AGAAGGAGGARHVLVVLLLGGLEDEVAPLGDLAVAVGVVLHVVAARAQRALAIEDARPPAPVEGVAHGVVDGAVVGGAGAEVVLEAGEAGEARGRGAAPLMASRAGDAPVEEPVGVA